MLYNSAYWNKQSNLKNRYYLCQSLARYKENRYLELIEQSITKKYANCLITDLYEGYYGYTGVIEYLAQKSQVLIGIDISQKVLAKTKKYITPHNLCCCASDIRDLAIKDGTIDLIFSPSTLDHFPEINQAFSEISRVLKKDGIFILALNNQHNFLFTFNIWCLSLIRYLPFHIEGCYTFKKIRNISLNHGFIIQGETTLMHVPFLFPTILSILERFNLKIFTRIFYSIILAIENIAVRSPAAGRFFGWWIVFILKKG